MSDVTDAELFAHTAEDFEHAYFHRVLSRDEIVQDLGEAPAGYNQDGFSGYEYTFAAGIKVRTYWYGELNEPNMEKVRAQALLDFYAECFTRADKALDQARADKAMAVAQGEGMAL